MLTPGNDDYELIGGHAMITYEIFPRPLILLRLHLDEESGDNSKLEIVITRGARLHVRWC